MHIFHRQYVVVEIRWSILIIFKGKQVAVNQTLIFNIRATYGLRPRLLTWFNFNPSMDKQLYPL